MEQLREAHKAEIEVVDAKRENEVHGLRNELEGEVKALRVELEATGAVSSVSASERGGRGEGR